MLFWYPNMVFGYLFNGWACAKTKHIQSLMKLNGSTEVLCFCVTSILGLCITNIYQRKFYSKTTPLLQDWRQIGIKSLLKSMLWLLVFTKRESLKAMDFLNTMKKVSPWENRLILKCILHMHVTIILARTLFM